MCACVQGKMILNHFWAELFIEAKCAICTLVEADIWARLQALSLFLQI